MKKQSFNKKTVYGFLLFCAVVGILGIPFKNWGFKTDDYGNIYHCKIEKLSDVSRFFYEGNMERFNHPSNIPQQDQAFFCGLYRPVSFLYYYLQYLLFGTTPYSYFLVTIILHALNSLLLFFLFCYFSSFLIALFAALFFAFHPSLWNWLGWVSAQTYQIEVLVLLLSLFSLKKYFETKKTWLYLLSCLLYASNLFLKEATIFFPIWIIPAGYLYAQEVLHDHQPLKKSALTSCGYWVVALFYLMCRAATFPLTSNTKTLTFEPTLASFVARQKSRLFDFVSYISDMIGLSWLPQGNPVLKGSIIVTVILFLGWLFYNSTKKRLMLFSFFSMILFSWPALLMHYQPRYIYMALPFFILLFVIGITSYQRIRSTTWLQKPCAVACTLLLLFQTSFLVSRFKQREHVLNQVHTSFLKLTHHEAIKDNPLCFVNLPRHWFAMGTAQAIWLLTNNKKPVYQYNTGIRLAGRSSYLQTPVVKHDLLSIEKNNDGFECTSKDSNTIWFENQGNTASISIPEKYRKQDPVYVTWDYQKGAFKIV